LAKITLLRSALPMPGIRRSCTSGVPPTVSSIVLKVGRADIFFSATQKAKKVEKLKGIIFDDVCLLEKPEH
jgi:hypothetical protein